MYRTAPIVCLALLSLCACGDVAPPPGAPADPGIDPARTVGVLLREPGRDDGYVLFAPMSSTTTWLVDNDGRVVHSWPSTERPGNSVYLLEDGSILRGAVVGQTVNPRFTAGGAAGRVQRIAWDGTVLWDYLHSGADYLHHHDIAPLPNGNVLLIAWEGKTSAEAVQAGRDPAQIPDGELWPDCVVEIEPMGLTGGTVVWAWHAWDHLIQDFDVTKDGFGVVADNPGLIDVNHMRNANADWMHSNAIDYNETFDQVLLCVHHFGEVWVIDHGTTTAEAAAHAGGRQGKGGDLLYRWGNPAAYGRGVPADQRLFGQHDARWLGDGMADMMVFNNGNGSGAPAPPFSSVVELVPPADVSGAYTAMPAMAFGPASAAWTWTEPVATDFYAPFISGAHRTSNGNTMVCDGPNGRFFEVTPAGAKVWEYVNPDIGSGVLDFDQEVPAGPNGKRNLVFRATRIAPGHPGLAGRDLTPGGTIEN